jgi:ankyrin repeat protein
MKSKYESLHEAAAAGDAKEINYLIDSGANVNPYYEGVIPLHLAACGGKPEAISALIDRGAYITAHDHNNNRTPLYYAVQKGHVDAVKILIKAEADLRGHQGEESKKAFIIQAVNRTDEFGETLLHEAVRRGHLETARVIIEMGAEVNAKTKFGLTPLHIAADEGRLEIIDNLIAIGADVNSLDRNEKTPFMLAAEKNHLESVKLLLSNRATVDLTNQHFDINISQVIFSHAINKPDLKLLRDMASNPFLLTNYLL